MSALKRNQERNIRRLLNTYPIVLILGVWQCGKSTLAKMLCPDWKYYDLENSRDHSYITSDIDFFLRENSEGVIIDEAQELPELFKNLRGAVDKDPDRGGRFILTGSSSPELINNDSEVKMLADNIIQIPVGLI